MKQFLVAFAQKNDLQTNFSAFRTADPEEFLNILFHHILRVDPLLKLR